MSRRPIRSELPWWRLERLARECHAWESEPIMFCGRRGKLEYFVHEVTHAVSLDLPIGADLSGRVSKRLFTCTTPQRNQNEALCLAAEFFILPRLDISIEPGDLAVAADVQGVPDVDWDTAFDSEAARQLADRVMAALAHALSPGSIGT